MTAKIRIRPAPPGRKGWPEIFTYVTRDGTHHCCPPPYRLSDGFESIVPRPYTLCIRDLAAFEALSRSGALYCPPHTTPRLPVIDGGQAR